MVKCFPPLPPYFIPLMAKTRFIIRDCAIITWRRRGVGKPEGGGASGKITHRKRGVDVKFNTYGGGHYFFHFFSQTRKVLEELCSVFAYTGIKLGKYPLRVF